MAEQNNDLYIYGAVRAMTEEGKAAYAAQVYDETRGKFQSAINDSFSADISDMMTEVFPLKIAVSSPNAGTYEIGTSITPSIVLDITRKGTDVASRSQVSFTPADGSLSQDKKTYTGAAISSGTKTYRVEVTQGGQTVVHDGNDSNDEYKNQLKFTFMNYRYRGAVSANNIPSDATAKTNYVKQLCQNNTISKELSTSTQLTGKNALAADKCYVFVIPTQSPNLIVKDANNGGVVDNAGTGTFELARVNGTGTVNCKYVIVPASSNTWNFEITNS
jgi:hypothetical protein